MPKCDQCGREFTTDVSLAQHLRDKHRLQDQVNSQGPESDRQTRAVRKSLRKKSSRTRTYAILAIIVSIGVGVYFVVSPAVAGPPFACISEGSYVHIHPYLVIVVNGTTVTIPASVGITQGGTCVEPVHTHDSSGILHLELSQSDLAHNWTLGDFFTIWKYTCGVQSSACPVVNGQTRPVVFNQTDILGFKADSSHKVQLLINGSVNTSWGSLPLLHYAYCTVAKSGSLPCGGPRGTASGDPAWDCVGGNCGTYPYKTGNMIEIEYSAA